jgi:hypothetical protein
MERAPLCIDKNFTYSGIFIYTYLTWRFSSDKGLEYSREVHNSVQAKRNMGKYYIRI